MSMHVEIDKADLSLTGLGISYHRVYGRLMPLLSLLNILKKLEYEISYVLHYWYLLNLGIHAEVVDPPIPATTRLHNLAQCN